MFYPMLYLAELDDWSCMNNTSVICNHAPPSPGAWRGIAGQICCVVTCAFSMQCEENARDSIYLGKHDSAM